MKVVPFSIFQRRVRAARTLRMAGVGLASLGLLAGCGGGGNDPPPPVAMVDTSCQLITSTGTVTVGTGNPGDPSLPEPSSGYKKGVLPVTAKSYMVVTNNPFASAAGCNVLKNGGSAIDAAVAIQAVLGLVEPQSSGLGGGAFMLHYNAKAKTLQTYDGRETAPAAATEDYLRFVSNAASGAPLPNARASGRSIGTPGVVRMLELAHRENGSKPWAELFQPGIKLAQDGFPISGRLSDAIVLNRTNLLLDPEARAYFLNADTSVKTLGTVLKNPEYASTLSTIASGGANAFYTGAIAQSIVNKIKVTSGGVPAVPVTPGLTEMSDMANYQARKREATCIGYRAYVVCGMPPPSSGGIAVAQTLGILENFNMAALRPTAIDGEGGKPTVQAVHLVSEAQRLAYADRDRYVADTDFVPLPGGGINAMLNKTYLNQRASLIRTERSMGTAQPGVFANAAAGGTSQVPENGTAHITIVDKDGNVVVMTSTVEASMGSHRFTRGFLLNNELTDFSTAPSDVNGPIANRVQPLKRPRSSMAPTLVFARNADGSRGDFVMGTGSVGGGAIIQYLTKTIIGFADWGLNAQQASSLVNFGAFNTPTTLLGGEHPSIDLTNGGLNDPLQIGLRALGHTVNTASQASGTGTIIRSQTGSTFSLQGGADPRREGIALGGGL